MVLIYTALSDEYASVTSLLRPSGLVKTRTGTRFAVSELRGNHVDWDVKIAEIGVGDASSAAEVAAGVEHFSPSLVLFVGVAAGLKPEDQNLGDVVVAERVYQGQSGKYRRAADGTSEFAARPQSFPAPHRLVQLARETARSAWQPAQARGHVWVHLKPIVASDAVVADELSDFRRRIDETYNDAAALDMESFGVYQAAHRADVPALAIRGLSDFASSSKTPTADATLQPRAADTAAAFALAVLTSLDLDDLPRLARTEPATPGRRSEDAAVEARDLPPHVAPWLARLSADDAHRGRQALDALGQLGSARETWLARLRHRPPPWLRHDTFGDAWGLVARYADAHRSRHAPYAYERAASAAADAGDAAAAQVHSLSMIMSAYRLAAAAAGPEEATAQARPALIALHDGPAGPVAQFLSAAVSFDADAVRSKLSAALHALVLPAAAELAPASGPPSASSGALADLAESFPGILGQLQLEVLLAFANERLYADDPGAARSAADAASAAVPESPEPLIAAAKSMLQACAAQAARGADADLVQAGLADAEQAALQARDLRAGWQGPTDDALALAGQIRIRRRDPGGALGMLLAPPDGTATRAEAGFPAVREAAALAAVMDGRTSLALELVDAVRDSTERELLRALALAREPAMGAEAAAAYRAALGTAPDDRPDQLVRALLGVVRAGASLDPAADGTVFPHLERLRRSDPEAADLVVAAAALHAGRPGEALVLARRYPLSASAVEIAADAAVAAGKPEDAVAALERLGTNRRDDAMLAHAMFTAARAGLDDDAARLAAALTRSHDPEISFAAFRTRIDLAGRAGHYDDVLRLCSAALHELDDHKQNTGPTPEQHEARRRSLRWAMASAEYNRRRPDRALQALRQPDPLRPRNRREALLLLAALRADDRALVPLDKVDAALAVARDWLDDEEVVAAAVVVTLLSSPAEPIPPPLLAEVRRLHEDYFSRFSDTRITRLDVGENLEGLTEHLRDVLAPGAEEKDELALDVWLGKLPRAILADAARRSYAEMEIRNDIGCRVLAGDGSEDRRAAAAADALIGGAVVIDTSALHLIGLLNIQDRRLLAEFARVYVPAALRDDILDARNSLSLRSPGMVGWDSRSGRPVLTKHSDDQVAGWEHQARNLAARAAGLETVAASDPSPDEPSHLLSAAVDAATRQGVPLWADDLALIYLAESEGARAFGTLDLLGVLAHRGSVTESETRAARAALRRAGAVDFPVVDELITMASEQNWEPDGYPALLLSRPRTWEAAGAAFGAFTTLIRALPPDEAAAHTPGWALPAAVGLARATPPGQRPRSAGALLAWTVLSVPEALPALADVADRVQQATCPAGDVFAAMIDTVIGTLESEADPSDSGAAFTRLVATLDDGRRLAALRRLLARRPSAARHSGSVAPP